MASLSGGGIGGWFARVLITAMLAAGVVVGEEKPRVVRAVEGLRFDPVRWEVRPGEVVRLRFENADTTAQPHNLVIGRPGSKEALIAAALALGADGPSRQFVPTSDDVVAATRVLNAGESEEVSFGVPGEAAVYPMVCTFPGHGVIMFGAVYAGHPMPRDQKNDPHVPQLPPAPPLDPDPRPMVRRIFLPAASPAAIAVAMPEGINFCWDAGSCQLRYLWLGEFLSTERHFQGKGQSLAQPAGPIVFTAPAIFPIQFRHRPTATPTFHGYSLQEGMPIFKYSLDGVHVHEGFSVVDGRLARRLQLPSAPDGVTLHLGKSDAVTLTASSGKPSDGQLQLTSAEAADVTIFYGISPPVTTPAAADDRPPPGGDPGVKQANEN